MRSLKQAESEDCDQVDIEHFEKILPQLVSCPPPKNNLAYINVYLCYLYVAKPFHKIVLSLFVSWILKCFCKLWCYMSICAVNMHLYTLCHLLPVWQIIIKNKYRALPVFTEPVFVIKLLLVFEWVFFKLSKLNWLSITVQILLLKPLLLIYISHSAVMNEHERFSSYRCSFTSI